MANGEFNRADLNRDGTLSSGEFSNFLGQNGIGYGASNGSGSGLTGGYENLSSYQSTTSGYGANASFGDAAFAGGAGGYGSNGFSSSSGYESSSLSGGGGYGAGGYSGASGYDASGVSGSLGYGGAGGYNASSSQFSSNTAVQSYPTDAQGLFQDSNPQIIRRPAQNNNVTYTQNIRVRFLQPPPVPPPGVSFLCFSLEFSI